MTGLDRESTVVLGTVAVLLLTSVASLALPAVQLADDDPTADRPESRDGFLTPSGRSTGEGGGSSSAPAGGTTQEPVATVECDPADVPSGVPVAESVDDVTGQGVSVAVIDPSGFETDGPVLGGRVASARAFDRTNELTVRNDGVNQHGTAAARQVARMAPDATLYLANFRSDRDFTRAVEWAIRQDVDVIVAPTVFYAKPNDGTAPVSRAVERAADEGIPVVVPTGNTADQHWEGTYDGGGAVEFAPNDTRMYIDGDGDRIEAWLWWNRSDTDPRDEFSVVLYRETDGAAQRVAESDDHSAGSVSGNQVLSDDIWADGLLSKLLSDGRHFLRIEGPPNATRRVELVVTTHRPEEPVPRGSVVAPATAESRGVISVGARSPSGDGPLPRSGRGPTNDGRRGVDVLAPATTTGEYSLTGTSAATSYTGGVVALMRARNPSLSPARVNGVLAATADGENVSEATGHGTVNRTAALECASTVPDVDDG